MPEQLEPKNHTELVEQNCSELKRLSCLLTLTSEHKKRIVLQNKIIDTLTKINELATEYLNETKKERNEDNHEPTGK